MTRRPLAAAAAVAALAVACTAAPPPPPASPTPAPTTTTTTRPSPSPPPSPREPAGFDADAAMHVVAVLADEIGPREATTAAYRRAAAYTRRRLEDLGYRVAAQRFGVPAGRSSNGEALPPGTTTNIVADRTGFAPDEPHILVGAHLDTVPGSPGANDNASGVAAMIEVARLAAASPPPLPVRFVAFGAEERRSAGDGGNTLGAQEYIARLSADERRAIRAVVVLDMIGAGEAVRVCHLAGTSTAVRRRLLALAERDGVPAAGCSHDRVLSDHGPFARAGVPAAWLWAGDHPTLHTPADTPPVVDADMLRRAGALAWALVRAGG